MCCSGRCQYENHMGDCRVSNFQKVKEITGHSACYIGGHCECPEEEEIWDKDYKDGNIGKWHKQIKSLIRRY